jgi:ribose transport system permease protein
MTAAEAGTGTRMVVRRHRARDIGYRFPMRYRIVWVAVIALIVVSAITAPAVLHKEALHLVTALAGVLALGATGQLLVIMQGGIDLSVPAVVAIASAVTVKYAHGNLMVVVVCALLAAGVAGLVNGLLVVVFQFNAVIVTLATAGIFAGVLELWTGSTFSQSGQAPKTLQDFAASSVGFVSWIAILAMLLTLVLAWILTRSRIGRGFVIVSTNPVAANVVGIRPMKYRLAAYVVAGLFYGAAGVLLSGFVGTPTASIGSPYQLTTIVAVALAGATLAGGPASVVGVAGAALFVVLLDQYLGTRGYSPGVRTFGQGIALVAAVTVVSLGTATGGWRSPLRRRRKPLT